MSEGEQLRLETIRPDQHFTEPPPRYTEATLVKELEEKGIGRPSTYASIISTIVEREYVNKDQGRFTPTMLGEKVSELLVKSFEDIFDVGFTARMEEELDEIEEGKLPWRTSVKGILGSLRQWISKRPTTRWMSYKAGIPTGQEVREVRRGRIARAHQPPRIFPRLLALSGLRFHSRISPKCGGDQTRRRDHHAILRQLRQGNDHQARPLRHVPRVHRLSGLQDDAPPGAAARKKRAAAGRSARRKMPARAASNCCAAHGRFGEFIGCQNYPKCKYTRPDHAGHQVPEVQRRRIRAPRHSQGTRTRRASSTAAAAIRIAISPRRHEPITEPCPKCGAPFIVEKRTKQGNFRACIKEGCDWEIEAPLPPLESLGTPPSTAAPAVSPPVPSGVAS